MNSRDRTPALTFWLPSACSQLLCLLPRGVFLLTFGKCPSLHPGLLSVTWSVPHYVHNILLLPSPWLTQSQWLPRWSSNTQASSHIRDVHPGWSFCLSHFPWGRPDSLVTSFRSFLQMSLFQLGSPRSYLIILLIYLDIILSTEHTLYFIKPSQQLWAEGTITSILQTRKRDPALLESVQKSHSQSGMKLGFQPKISGSRVCDLTHTHTDTHTINIQNLVTNGWWESKRI